MEEDKDGDIMEKEYYYVYTVIREDFVTGERGKRAKKYYAFEPKLKVGGLYAQLGVGFSGCQRVLSVDKCEI